MRHRLIFVLAALLAALAPSLAALRAPTAAGPDDAAFPGWPSRLDGKALTRLPLTEREQAFAAGFPGRIGRFTDGEREVVLRFVTRATRRLHSAEVCMRGLGFEIENPTLWRDPRGDAWRQFTATRPGESQLVRERILGDDGRSWTDVSSWYWSAVTGRSPGPWWLVTVAAAR